MCGESLHAQAAIHVWRQQLMNPSCIFTALLYAIHSSPQGNHGDEPRFLFGNQHQASRKSGDALECSRERGGNGGLHAMRFRRLGHEFHAQGGHARRNGWGCRRFGVRSKCSRKTECHIFCCASWMYGTCHCSSQGFGPPEEAGRRIQVRSGQARMRLLGHARTGVGSLRRRIPE
jgi:hypothetical protein